MKCTRLIFTLLLLAAQQAHIQAQQRLVSEVRKSMSELTVTIDNLKNGMNKLKSALTNDETKNRAETWYVAGRVQYRMYEKYQSNRAIGKKVDAKTMGHTLIDGYDYFSKSLQLDTITERDKQGNPKRDKKTGEPKIKTKFSADINNRLFEHLYDYNKTGGELYNIKDWDGAYRAWDIFCKLAELKPGLVPDTLLGQARYFQAITSWQKNDIRQAVNLFEKARTLGYNKKEAYDYALVCLTALNDDSAIVRTASDAYSRFGVSDLQYIRILINHHINHKEWDTANLLLDQAIVANDSDAELQNLKGMVIEQKDGLDAAFPYFKNCLKLSPNNALALFNCGRYYYNQAASLSDKNPKLSRKEFRKQVTSLYREAMPYFEKALQLEPNNDEVRNALRNIYYRLGEGRKLEALDKQ